MKKKFNLKQSLLGYCYVSNPPTPEKLSEYYSKKYFKINPRYSEKTKKYEEEYHKNQSLIKLYFIKKYLKVKKPKILDLGAGTGRFIYHVSKYCKKVVGVDFSNNQLRYRLRKNSHFIAEEPFKFLKRESLDYEIITLNNIIEHASKPSKIFSELTKKIKKNTLLLVCLPNDFSNHQKFFIDKKMVTKKYWLSFPDHLHYFNSKSFHKYTNSHGFKIIDTIADFPVELLLFEKNFNYIDKDIGKNIHKLRCNFINYLYKSNSMDDVINFFKSIYKIGMGRNNYYLLKKK